ncbi:xanthine dehydrogenase accessory protein XdhC [Pontivivens insulae]|nr:xanthine dehydrogenase accessory protein XdhC [Pontivivens insulae]
MKAQGFDIEATRRIAAAQGAVARILITGARGSVPREAGTSMLVWADGQDGTIGGGTLEWEAVAEARALLTSPVRFMRRTVPLGPALGQCCGGSVDYLIERFEAADLDTAPAAFARRLDGPKAMPFAVRKAQQDIRQGSGAFVLEDGWIIEPLAPARTPLWLYGAGHVGRAVVGVFADLPFDITWVDDAPERFPEPVPQHVSALLAANPAEAVQHAPADAIHIVLTYSHTLDLELCHQVLLRPAAHLGLIGSDTKAARFRTRLAALGHDPATIARLNCPIGDRSLGKEPGSIAIGLAAELLQLRKMTGGLTQKSA